MMFVAPNITCGCTRAVLMGSSPLFYIFHSRTLVKDSISNPSHVDTITQRWNGNDDKLRTTNNVGYDKSAGDDTVSPI